MENPALTPLEDASQKAQKAYDRFVDLVIGNNNHQESSQIKEYFANNKRNFFLYNKQIKQNFDINLFNLIIIIFHEKSLNDIKSGVEFLLKDFSEIDGVFPTLSSIAFKDDRDLEVIFQKIGDSGSFEHALYVAKMNLGQEPLYKQVIEEFLSKKPSAINEGRYDDLRNGLAIALTQYTKYNFNKQQDVSGAGDEADIAASEGDVVVIGGDYGDKDLFGGASRETSPVAAQQLKEEGLQLFF